MTGPCAKADLQRYLQAGRAALRWKLEGLPEYDVRRPLTPTGTNLEDTIEPNSDLWATADESREEIVTLYQRAWSHADATINALPLEAPGHVPWWQRDRGEVTLHRVLVHVIAETHRHAGHADIVRELVDGAAGLRAGNDNLPPGADPGWWAGYRNRVEAAAKKAAGE
jgi:hypothetical protein